MVRPNYVDERTRTDSWRSVRLLTWWLLLLVYCLGLYLRPLSWAPRADPLRLLKCPPHNFHTSGQFRQEHAWCCFDKHERNRSVPSGAHA